MMHQNVVENQPMSDKLYKALTIKERAELMDLLEDLHLSEEVIQRELEQWKKSTLLKPHALVKRLESDRLDEKSFAKVLSISKNSQWTDTYQFVNKPKPKWMEFIDEAFGLNRNHPIQKYDELPITYAFRPFLLWSSTNLEEFYQRTPTLAQKVNWEILLASLMYHLAAGLTQIGGRTIVLEMHVTKQMKELNGQTSVERYESFIKEKIMDPDYLEFLYSEYPVLARLLMLRTKYFVDNAKEALTRLDRDWSLIQELFEIHDEQLMDISSDMGDSHQKGKTVMKFKFSSGSEILYKPKQLSLAHHFNELMDWFNQKGFKPELKGYKMIDRSDYAWEERVEYKSCDSIEQIQYYYKRLGGLLGILYMVNGADFHAENIIANGEYPTLIDLETLFHHTPKLDTKPTAEMVANIKITHSVIGTALLPHLSFRNPNGKGIDLSGMSSTDQELPVPVLQVEKDGTDEMRYVRKPLNTKEGDQNVPKLNNRIVHAGDYVESILEGFHSICEIMLTHKTELLQESGVLANFKHDIIRVIVRPTQYYGNFVIESSHPDYLRDWLERDQLIEKVWFTLLDIRTIAAEKEDLLNHDIPMFYTTPGSTALYSSTGEEIPDYYDESSYDYVINRMKELSWKEIDEQANWIKASIVSNTPEKKIKTSKLITEQKDIQTELFIKEAEMIGYRLLDQAIYGKHNDATWIGLDTNYFGQWHVASLEKGLYNGLGGIVLFLSYLNKITQKGEFKELADKALETILNTPNFSRDFSSAFFGQASHIYVLSHIMGLNGHNGRIRTTIDQKIAHIGNNVNEDHYFDLLGGAAGIIQVLLNAYEQFNSEQAIAIAQQYGDHLVHHKIKMKKGVGWPDHTNLSQASLGGFSHGTSGIAWSLLRLHHLTGKEEYLQTALEAIEYDRSLYNEQEQNWSDLRCSHVKSGDFSTAWCHGAAGIGLSRLLYLPYLNDSSLHQEIQTALTTTADKGMGRSHSLCHGDLGNSELFLKAGLEMNHPDYTHYAQSIGLSVIEEKQEKGHYLTGVSQHLELPGLFLGLSGIGYQLLRLAKPHEVPSVLTLEKGK